MRNFYFFLQKWFFLWLLSICVSGCVGFVKKPIMPIEQGISLHLLDKTRIDKKPAPTVLLFSGCGGIHGDGGEEFFSQKTQWLNAHGFNAVVFDYVGVMGLKTACYGQIKREALLDLALAAFRYTAGQPYVDHDRLILLGWSMGASLALTVADKTDAEVPAPLAAVVAYYPGCYEGLKLSRYPTLLLLGMADNVVDPKACLALAQSSPETPLLIKTYPDAQHNFDNVEFKNHQTTHFLWKKFTSAYDPAAAQAAEKVLAEFLEKYK